MKASLIIWRKKSVWGFPVGSFALAAIWKEWNTQLAFLSSSQFYWWMMPNGLIELYTSLFNAKSMNEWMKWSMNDTGDDMLGDDFSQINAFSQSRIDCFEWINEKTTEFFNEKNKTEQE